MYRRPRRTHVASRRLCRDEVGAEVGERPGAAHRPSDSRTACLQGTGSNSESNSISRLEVSQATTAAARGQIRPSGYRRLAEIEAMLQARTRARAPQQRYTLHIIFSQSRPQADFVPHFAAPTGCYTGSMAAVSIKYIELY